MKFLVRAAAAPQAFEELVNWMQATGGRGTEVRFIGQTCACVRVPTLWLSNRLKWFGSLEVSVISNADANHRIVVRGRPYGLYGFFLAVFGTIAILSIAFTDLPEVPLGNLIVAPFIYLLFFTLVGGAAHLELRREIRGFLSRRGFVAEK